MKSWIHYLVPLAVLLAAVMVRIAEPPFVEDLQLRVFDTYQHLKPRPYQETPVRIVAIGDESLARFGQWPWPRVLTARLVERLSELGARVVAFDILFAEPDRTSPKDILPLWPEVPEIQSLLKKIETLPDHDRVLAEEIRKAPVVTGFALGHQKTSRNPATKTMFSYAGKSPGEFLPLFEGAVTNLPELEAAASGQGAINTLQERDGVIRRIPLVFRLEDKLYPSLAAETLRLYESAPAFLIRHTEDGGGGKSIFQDAGLTGIQIGKLSTPSDSQGRMWLYDTGFQKDRFIPAWKVLLREIESDDLQGKIVFLGAAAAGLMDLRVTPRSPATAGVEIHAQIAEQILLNNFLKRPGPADAGELAYMLALGSFVIFLMPLWGAGATILIFTAGTAAILGFSWHAFTGRGWLLDPALPTLLVLPVYLISALIHFLETESEKRRVRQAFSRYMSPALVEQLAQHPEQLKLGGEIKNVTVLFSDIRGFTGIAEKLTAQELTTFMNRYMTPMTHIILKHKGTIDKYIGDCIMAFWNAPLDDPKHPFHACLAALQMKSHLVEWNKTLYAEARAKGKTYLPIHIGIGINTGDCCVGNMGSDQRFDYSVLGDDVNLASRLEGQTKVYGIDIVAGEHTYAKTPELAWLEIDLIRVQGRKHTVRIYALFGDTDFKNRADFQTLLELHYEMLAAYRSQDWEEAAGFVEKCKTFDTPNTRLRKLYELYEERLENYRKHPPGTAWDGIAAATGN